MPERLEDPAVIRPVLERDPILNCTTIARIFYPTDTVWDTYVDDPRKVGGIMLVSRAEKVGGKVGLEFRVFDDGAFGAFASMLEAGRLYDIGAARENTVGFVRERFDIVKDEPCVFLALLRPERFRAEVGQGLERLREEDADIIEAHWGLAEGYRDFFARRIREGPAWGVRRDGELIAWMGTYFITDRVVQLGYLHVREAHRRKGLGRSLMARMVGDILKDGLIPVAYVFSDNAPSLELFASLGFERIDYQSWLGGRFRGP